MSYNYIIQLATYSAFLIFIAFFIFLKLFFIYIQFFITLLDFQNLFILCFFGFFFSTNLSGQTPLNLF